MKQILSQIQPSIHTLRDWCESYPLPPALPLPWRPRPMYIFSRTLYWLPLSPPYHDRPGGRNNLATRKTIPQVRDLLDVLPYSWNGRSTPYGHLRGAMASWSSPGVIHCVRTLATHISRNAYWMASRSSILVQARYQTSRTSLRVYVGRWWAVQHTVSNFSPNRNETTVHFF